MRRSTAKSSSSSAFQPKLVNKVKLYTKETSDLREFGIQPSSDKALRAKVWLKSAATSSSTTPKRSWLSTSTRPIRCKGSTRLETTIVRPTSKPSREIVRQIRLRDLGGTSSSTSLTWRNAATARGFCPRCSRLSRRQGPSKAAFLQRVRLVCITRKRTKQALERVSVQPCPYCTGSAMVKSIPTLCYEIQGEARKMATADPRARTSRPAVNPEIAKALKTASPMLIDELEQPRISTSSSNPTPPSTGSIRHLLIAT